MNGYKVQLLFELALGEILSLLYPDERHTRL